MLRFDVYSWFPGDNPVCISPGDGCYFQSSIHPDGDHALFWGGANGPARIWRADLDGNSCEPLTPADTGARHPSYCANGERIVFVSSRAVKQQPELVEVIFGYNTSGAPRRDLMLHIFSMKPDGSDVQQITEGPVQDQRPTLSPDGQQVCFVSIRGGSFGLWIAAIDGSRQPQKLETPVPVYRPVWSQDGERIYGFTVVKGDRHKVGWVSPKDGSWHPLENDDQGSTHGPFPDPCGKNLLIHSNRHGRWSIYELPLDGHTPPRRLIPPGFENALCVHPTRATNGAMTFDSIPDGSWAQYNQHNRSLNY